MKKITLFLLLFYSITNVKGQNKNNTTYLNGSNKIITEKEFRKLPKSFEAKNDSLNIKKAVVFRKDIGKLTYVNEITKRLKKLTPLDTLSPIIVIFYPGKDLCNSTGSASKAEIERWYDDLGTMTYKIAKVKPIYLYKSKEGLERQGSILKWHKDPESIIENTFFEFHYPCSSYVIISPNGNYIAYFGEFSKDGLISNLKEILLEK